MKIYIYSGKLSGIDPFIGSESRLNRSLLNTSLVQAASIEASDDHGAALGSDLPLNVAINVTDKCVVISDSETFQGALTGFLM